MKAVELLVESGIPEDLRMSGRQYTAKGIGELLSDVAVHYPDKFPEVVKHISDVGRKATYRQGESIRLSDLRSPIDKPGILAAMHKEIAAAGKALGKDSPEFDKAREDIWTRYNDIMEKETAKQGLAQGNSIAMSVLSGARGKNPQLKAMISSPGIFADDKGRIVPVFVERSYAEGIRPADFLASTYGARSTVTVSKKMTAKGGDFGKQLVQANIRNKVMANDCGTDAGLDLDIGDASLSGRVLALDAGGYPAGTVLDRKVIRDLEKQKVGKVVARSAVTCSLPEGLCSRCVGKFHDRKFPAIGDMVGVRASQAVSEPVVQGSLNLKHLGGQAGKKRVFAGFDVLNSLVQSPENFQHKATVAEADGRVDKVEEAPQGGFLVHIGTQEHYVPPGYPLLVKVGQDVERGDQLSEGIADPSDIVRLRGIGSGRRYLAERLHQALEDSGFGNDKRNVEIVSRSLVNHAEILDDTPFPGKLPGDLMEYNRLSAEYVPSPLARKVGASEAAGKVLQARALHYGPGTRLTKRQAKRLGEAGYKDVWVGEEEPPFQPVTHRLRVSQDNTDDWLAGMYGSYLKAGLTDAATRGQDTNIRENTHFAPRLAVGTDFGKTMSQTGNF